MTQNNDVSTRNPNWPLKFLDIVYEIKEDDIPDTVDRALMEEQVTRAIEKARKDRILTENQLSLLEALCGRFAPVQTPKQLADSKGLKRGSLHEQILQATNKFSKMDNLLKKLKIV